MSNKIYIVKKKDIYTITKRDVVYMDSQEVTIKKNNIVNIYYFDKEKLELKSCDIDTFWQNKKGSDTRFTFLQLLPNTPASIYKDGTADYFDNAKIASVDQEDVKIRIARVLMPNQFEYQN